MRTQLPTRGTFVALLALSGAMLAQAGCSQTDVDDDSSAATAHLEQTAVVRNAGGPFTVSDGILYRVNENSDLVYGPANDAKAPETVLAHVDGIVEYYPDNGGPIAYAYEHTQLDVTKDFVVIRKTVDDIRRVSRSTGAVQKVSRFGFKADLGVSSTDVGDDATVYAADWVDSQVWKLTPGAASSERVDPFASVAMQGKRRPNDLRRLMAVGGDVLIGDFYAGVGRIDTATNSFEWLGTTGTPFGAFQATYEIAADGDNAYAVVWNSGLNNEYANCPGTAGAPAPKSKSVFSMPRSGILGTAKKHLFDVSPYLANLQVDAKNFYFQDYCTGDVVAMNKANGSVSTLATRTKTDPVNRDLPGAGDLYQHQYAIRVALDGGYLYFLDDRTIKRVATP